MTITVIDTETSGLSVATGAEVIQIAAIDISREMKAINPRQTFVRPTRTIPPETSAIHGIVDADVADAPLYGDAVARFRGPDVVYVAHNAAFDRGFLHGLEGRWICTMKVARRVWPEAPNHKNQTLRYMLGLLDPLGMPRAAITAHEALSDVYVTGALFVHILQARLASFADMLEWSGQPDVVTRWPVGKHRGVRLADVPTDYLEWAAKSELGADLKAAAAAEVAARKVGKAA